MGHPGPCGVDSSSSTKLPLVSSMSKPRRLGAGRKATMLLFFQIAQLNCTRVLVVLLLYSRQAGRASAFVSKARCGSTSGLWRPNVLCSTIVREGRADPVDSVSERRHQL